MKLLDTNICSALIEGGDVPLRLKFEEQHDELMLCSVVKAELLYGARASSRVEDNLGYLAPLFANLPSLPFDDSAAEHYAAIRALLKREGRQFGANDMLIAAIAVAHDLTVVTRNVGEFSRVPGLRIERW